MKTPNRVADVCAFIIVALSVVAFFFVSGCGNQALKANAVIASGMLSVQEESNPVIRRARVAALLEAAEQAHEGGLALGETLARVEETKEEWTCAIDGHALYSAAVTSYIEVLALVNAGAPFDIVTLIRFGVRALSSWRALDSCLESLGVDFPTPDFVNLIPLSWEERETDE